MGPNARPRWVKNLPKPEPMTHEQVDKILSPSKQRARAARTAEQWVIRSAFDSGDSAYWGTQRYGGTGLTPYRANAYRYESENAALHVGYELKAARRLGEFTVERLPPKRRGSGGGGTGGRA
jgi:hypothetical protein